MGSFFRGQSEGGRVFQESFDGGVFLLCVAENV